MDRSTSTSMKPPLSPIKPTSTPLLAPRKSLITRPISQDFPLSPPSSVTRNGTTSPVKMQASTSHPFAAKRTSSPLSQPPVQSQYPTPPSGLSSPPPPLPPPVRIYGTLKSIIRSYKIHSGSKSPTTTKNSKNYAPKFASSKLNVQTTPNAYVNSNLGSPKPKPSFPSAPNSKQN